MTGYEFETFGTRHLAYLLGTVVWWFAVISFGRAGRNPGTRRTIVWALVALSIGQELAWDAIGIRNGVWQAAEHLPLHLCSMALVLSAFALATRRQFAFEIAYFWGFVAATQALLTPDPARWAMGEFDAFWNFLSHGVIVLNVLWLVFVEGMRVRRGAWLKVFALTNVVAVGVGVFDWVTGYNYLFLRAKPGGDSPFLVGEWPWYLLALEALAILFMFVAEQPMRWMRARESRGAPGPGAEPALEPAGS